MIPELILQPPSLDRKITEWYWSTDIDIGLYMKIIQVNKCNSDIRTLMIQNTLKINDSKTAFFIFISHIQGIFWTQNQEKYKPFVH